MAILKIIKNSEQELRRGSKPVEHINLRILTLLDDMRETLRETSGVGLAAPQVGVFRRVFIVEDVEGDGEIYELINPEIEFVEGEVNDTEGCLSFPGQVGYVRRPKVVRIRALDRNGDECIYEGTDILARAFCHEIDHLNGDLFFDKCDRLLTNEEIDELENQDKRKNIKRKFRRTNK